VSGALYGLLGAGLIGIGLHGALVRRHLFRRILGLNILGSGIFVLLVAGAPEPGDPVSQAMVLTGIVVTVAATALALALALRHAVHTGLSHLPEDEPT
jgi:multicomponent Na+:H+ antiporter subunit C